ncbi:5-oxoprolinase subunit PxpB [Candidatus Oscillochloris fontis]|uniref:5-oxoprolinase subunit PxpB n=1 Tax=Candidatus Oscillochloris fontis TaxID=2496868 RepID=UPI00101DBDC8|nr:5-oxoprolinase subunit PxpB [Candidatus Oscillochloris fontis]
MHWNFSPLGDSALLMEAQGENDVANQAVLALSMALEANPPTWLRAVVPAIASLLVCFAPLNISHNGVIAHLHKLLKITPLQPAEQVRVLRIPVHYGGDDGPDLDAVSRLADMTPTDLITLHCAQPYRVMMIGFAPGFPYIGPLPAAFNIPRRATPRSAVPPGSVALAAGMTGIYPSRLPGGWHIIGRTEVSLFHPQASPPATLRPGDMVQFVAVVPDLPRSEP